MIPLSRRTDQVAASRMLSAAGAALHGPSWESALASELNVDTERVEEWMSGRQRVPQATWDDLARLLQIHAQACAGLSDALRAGEGARS
jgi:hypothetical protein